MKEVYWPTKLEKKRVREQIPNKFENKRKCLISTIFKCSKLLYCFWKFVQ